MLRRYPEAGAFLAFGLREGRVVALFAVDRPRDILVARTWLSHEPVVAPARSSDPGFDLRSVRS